jgi:ADP-L-glycero-D-manno-heptose 6-epimerase
MASPLGTPTLRPRTLMSVGKKQTIITGAAGLLGRNLVAALNVRDEANLLLVDDLGSGEKWRNLQGLQFDDIVSTAEFREKVSESGVAAGSVVFHLAPSEPPPSADVSELIDWNCKWARELCEACAKTGARLIYTSSVSTYGDGELGFFDNDNTTPQLKPLDPEGFSKQLFDAWALRNGHLARITGLKLFDLYGPGEDYRGVHASLVNTLYHQIRDDGEARLPKSRRPEVADGDQAHDFLHVKDAVSMLLFIQDKPEAVGLFNAGTGQARTFADVARAVFAAVGEEPDILFGDMPDETHSRFQYSTQADVSRLRAAGFSRAMLSLEDGVKDYVTKYLRPRYPLE